MTLLLVLALAGGCDDDTPSSSQAASELELGCASPSVTDIGVPVIDRPTYFTSSGGRVRIAVSDLPGGLLSSHDETLVWLGEGTVPPTPDATHPTRPSTSRHEVVVGLEAPVVTELAAGRWWLVAARNGRITLETCSGAGLSDVQPAKPDGREVFGVPSDALTDRGTPGSDS